MGIVVKERQIVGSMVYAISARGCVKIEKVVIKIPALLYPRRR